MWHIFILWMLAHISTIVCADPTVTTESMVIEGRYSRSYKNRLYEVFEGIPYAQPPVGENRFQPPRPITNRSEQVVFARNEPNFCIQYDYVTRQITGEEDCLYLNVYVPVFESNNHSSLPIIIWFHEGAFQRGAGSYTKAKYLMDRDVILVTLNYRLGLFGFLSTEDSIVSGNMGLKDQNLAIRWVFENIRFFGGDPKNISLFGASAGGSSVQYHYLSKSSAGLFRNGVSFSGTALSPWAYDPKPLETTKQLANAVGCSIENSVVMVNCLKNLSARVLLIGTKQIMEETIGPDYHYPLFMPVAEKNVSDYFINRSPEEILRSGDVYDVPWISGVVSEEEAFIISSLISKQTRLNYMNENWEKLLPYALGYNKILPIHLHAKVARDAKQHYVKSEHLKSNEQTFWGLLHMMTDESFFIFLEKAARLQAKANKSPVYTYFYEYKAAMSTSPSTKFNVCTNHLDDIFLVLENQYIDPTTTEEDRSMLEIMLDFWYSAATTGPRFLNMELPRVDPKDPKFEYLKIASPSSYALENNDNFGDKKFWSSVGFNLES